jgi:hypothetical protein
MKSHPDTLSREPSMSARRTHPVTLICLAVGLVFLVAEWIPSMWGPGCLRPPYGPVFTAANAVEAVLWTLIGAVTWVRLGSQASSRAERRLVAAMSATLVLFGSSDVAEIYTGAWWRPWWLLGWKLVAIVAIVLLSAILYEMRTASVGPRKECGNDSCRPQ